MTTLEEILPDLHNVKVFSTLDVRNGFWHVQLTEKSSKVTAFWTPFGRYVWRRLPFGLSCSPEIFQQKLQQALLGLNGIEVLVDDILIAGRGNTEAEAVEDHNRNLMALLQRCRDVGIKLNKAKMKLNQSEVRFFGHVLSKDGLKPDPQKAVAISSMETPKDAVALQRFLGVVNYMAKFIPKLSETSVPLREALASGKWKWGVRQKEAFNDLKKKIARLTTLKFFDPKLETTIQCDASSYALGSVLMQEGQPIMFASRMLSKTEQKYAQIEKETLAILFSCKRFDQYIFGNKQVTVETDHLPLQTIFKKPLSAVPKRIQRMILSLQRYDLNVKYVKGSMVIIADTLSRSVNAAHLAVSRGEDPVWKSIEEVNALDAVDLHEDLLVNIQRSTDQDEVSQVLKEYIMSGWPKDKDKVEECAKAYFPFHCELIVQDGVILRADRIVVPARCRQLILEMLHYSHQGEQATLRKAREVVYWPNMTDHIRNFVKKCEVCNRFRPFQQCEPMQSSSIPEFPYDVVSMDLGEIAHNGKKLTILVSVDHYSNYFDVDILSSQSTSAILECTKRNFSRLGIPRHVITDSAKQFTGEEWQQFMRNYGIRHSTSAPYHHEANGKAESSIKIAKNVLKKAWEDGKDVWLALLEWRNTPQADGYSPIQKLMGRSSRGLFPVPQHRLKIMPIDGERIREEIELRKVKSKFYHDRKAQELPSLVQGQEVYVQLRPESSSEWSRGRVEGVLSDRDYLVDVGGARYRRNRKFVRDAYATLVTGTPPDPSTTCLGSSSTALDQESFSSAMDQLELPVTSTPVGNDTSAIKPEPSTSNQLARSGEASSTAQPGGASRRSVRPIRQPLRFDDYVLNQ